MPPRPAASTPTTVACPTRTCGGRSGRSTPIPGRKPVRLFTAMLGTETNTFSPIPAGLRLYQDFYLVRGGRHPEPYGFFALPLVRFRERARALGWEVVESLATFAPPAAAT